MKRHALFCSCLLLAIAISWGGLGTSHGIAAGREGASLGLKGTLVFFDWQTFQSGLQGKRVVQAYMRMHPGVTIKLLPLPPGDPTVWEESQLAAGAAPDIMSPSYTPQVWNDLPKNAWLDLTPYLYQPNPYIPGNKRWIDSMNPAMNRQNAFEGAKYYVISWADGDAAFYYNKDIFARVGITHVPTTWAEYLADCARIKRAGYVPSEFPLGDPYPIAENGSIMSLFEAQVMDKTFKRLDMDHNGVVDIKELIYGFKHHIYSPLNPDYQQAWKLVKQWSQYWEPNPAGVKTKQPGYQTGLPLFIQGKAATQYGGQFTVLDLKQDKLKFHWGVFKMPQITPASSPLAGSGEKPIGIWGPWNSYAFGVPRVAAQRGHLALAIDFLRWISAPRNEVPVVLENSQLPVVKGYQPGDTFTRLFYDILQHPTMQFASEATLGPEWLKDRIATQQAYLTGQESLDQAMVDMQRYTTQAADRLIKIYHLSM